MSGNAIVLWVLGGAGVVLLYAAVKDVPATDVLSGKMFHANAVAAPVGNGIPASGGSVHPVSDNRFSNDGGTGYWKGTDTGTGMNYLYDGSGAVIGTVPGTYAKSPGTYIQNA